jgi:hypothetical protein
MQSSIDNSSNSLTILERAPRRFLTLGTVALASALLAGGVHAQSGNWLYLDLDQAHVRYVQGSEAPITRDLTRTGQCQLNVTQLNDLLHLTSPSGAIGWRPQDARIGVNGVSSGEPCTQIRDGQSIKLALGTMLQTQGQQVVSATVMTVVENKPADLVVTARLAGGSESPVHHFEQECGVGSCEIDLPRVPGKVWDELSISVAAKPTGESGTLSLTDAEFELLPFVPEGDLACNEGDTEGGATLRRLDDIDLAAGNGESKACEKLLPYRLDFDGSTLAFLVDYSVIAGDEVEPTFAFEVTWNTEWVPAPFPSAVEYYPGFNPPSSPQTTIVQSVPLSVQQFLETDELYLLDMCPGEPEFGPIDPNDTESEIGLIGMAFPADFNDSEGGPNDMSTFTGFQFGCLADRKIEIVSEGDCPESADSPGSVCVRVTETGFLRGDWTVTRAL